MVAPKPKIETPPVQKIAAAETPRQGTAPTQGASDVRGPGTGAGGVGTGTGSGTGGNGPGGGGGVAVPASLVRGITGRDYPSAIQRNWPRGGIVYLRLRIEATGRPSRCDVMRSFGDSTIDQWTCSLIMERGQFRPALDARGAPVAPGSATSRSTSADRLPSAPAMIEVEWWEYNSLDELADAVAGDVGFIVDSAVDARNASLIAIPGGRTGPAVYTKLAAQQLPWKRVTVIPTDDRLVPMDSDLSNVREIARAFLPTGARVIPIATEIADYKLAGGRPTRGFRTCRGRPTWYGLAWARTGIPPRSSRGRTCRPRSMRPRRAARSCHARPAAGRSAGAGSRSRAPRSCRRERSSSQSPGSRSASCWRARSPTATARSCRSAACSPRPSSRSTCTGARKNILAETRTFLARVLKQIPLLCRTVIVAWPVLLMLWSSTTPDLPAWVPAITMQASPLRTFDDWASSLDIIASFEFRLLRAGGPRFP